MSKCIFGWSIPLPRIFMQNFMPINFWFIYWQLKQSVGVGDMVSWKLWSKMGSTTQWEMQNGVKDLNADSYHPTPYSLAVLACQSHSLMCIFSRDLVMARAINVHLTKLHESNGIIYPSLSSFTLKTSFASLPSPSLSDLNISLSSLPSTPTQIITFFYVDKPTFQPWTNFISLFCLSSGVY